MLSNMVHRAGIDPLCLLGFVRVSELPDNFTDNFFLLACWATPRAPNNRQQANPGWGRVGNPEFVRTLKNWGVEPGLAQPAPSPPSRPALTTRHGPTRPQGGLAGVGSWHRKVMATSARVGPTRPQVTFPTRLDGQPGLRAGWANPGLTPQFFNVLTESGGPTRPQPT
jgi:hypothetical protein